LAAVFNLLATSLQLKTTLLSCQIIRKILEILAVLTVVTSSGSILVLSFERYVACIHCFRVHEIVSEKRVNRSLYGIWTFGLICSFLDEKHYKQNTARLSMQLTKTLSIIYVITVLSCSTVLAYIQIRLYRLSRKLMKVHPGSSFGRGAEANDLRRNQMKVSIVASSVIGLYMICMVPLACYIVFTSFKESNEQSKNRLISIFLVQVNAFVDSFVYGLGMADTRKAMAKELRKAKTVISELIC